MLVGKDPFSFFRCFDFSLGRRRRKKHTSGISANFASDFEIKEQKRLSILTPAEKAAAVERSRGSLARFLLHKKNVDTPSDFLAKLDEHETYK